MASKENNVFNQIRLEVSKWGTRLFRVNSGRAWTGNNVQRLNDGSVLIRDPRPFTTGVPKGFSDGAGWTQVEITPEMVGSTVAVFTAIEAKTKTGRASKEQLNFIDQVQAAGGLAGIARSAEDAVEIIKGAH